MTRQRSRAVEEVKDAAYDEEKRVDLALINREVCVDKVISTGSTLLDLVISGGRRRGGGIPGGIVIEVSGRPATGKTALLAEMCASAQSRGGEARFGDPEARLDQEYTRTYGVSLADNFAYCRPDTVVELFDDIWEWSPSNPGAINIYAGDSLAALSTEMEMEEEDKRGQKRAKDFSQELRKSCRMIAKNNWLIAFSNQVRQGDMGDTTPGGMALPFYASLRIRLTFARQNSQLIREIKIGKEEKEETKKRRGKEKEKKTTASGVYGIRSVARVIKSSIDVPFGEAPITIIFGYGIDSIRDELQYYKDMTGEPSYNCFHKTYVSMEQAISFIEEHDLELDLKERTINLWERIQKELKIERKPKTR